MEALFSQKEGEKILSSYTWEIATKMVDRFGLQKWFAKTFERLQIKSTYITHWDNISSECLKTHNLIQATLV